MQTKVRKAVLPVAGLGTRFIPASKATPKEMFPIVDKPIILHIVEEAVSAGIDTIILVTGRHKTSLEEFFDRNYELEDTLAKQNKDHLLKEVQRISKLANILSVRQKNPLGLGHAVLCAQSAIGDEPFAVLLGDEVMYGKPNVTEQLVNVYNKEKKSTVAVMEVDQSEVSKYGIAETKKNPGKMEFSEIEHLIEKPKPNETKSRLALPGRYVFTPTIFKILRELKPSKLGEIQLTDAILKLAQTEGVLAYSFNAERFDAGDRLGFVTANIEFGLKHPEISEPLKKYIKEKAEKLK
ncbi:MAG: UTP--glucose-1-phosphate uridylyltransferase GalU [Oligoflexia bacterium]|nr:UTP--glucose-1-phosphate uridylyltransferase GalU [Oligoflexia bacterium]